MVDSFRTELRDIIDRVYIGEYGGRATQQMVHEGVWRDLPEHLLDYLVGKGIRSEVQAYFRTQGTNGLPKFPEINADGEHRQLELLTIEEYAYLHSSYVSRSDANKAQAEKVRELCLDTHGVDLAEAAVSA